MQKHKITLLLGAFTIFASSTFCYARGPIEGITAENSFIVYYGDDYYENISADSSHWILNESIITALAQYDVVVVQPNQPHFTPEIVSELKDRGVAHVLGYISIGEDFIDDAVEDPLANGTGMTVLDKTTNTLVPSNTNDLQSFYLDVFTQTVTYNEAGTVIAVTTEATPAPDGKPDYNPHFLGYMINPDTNWRWVIDNMAINRDDVAGRRTKAGLKQLSRPRDSTRLRDRSGDFGFDGFFLDTLDTAGPYQAPGWYPWTIQEMSNTVKYISDTYPDKLVFANRGAFYFTAGLQSPVTQEYSIDYSIRPYINAFLFESFRYDSNALNPGITPYYEDNRFNIAPKVLAEANRPDGFTVFGLEYQSGRTDIVEDAFNTAVNDFGFVSYLASDGALDSVNNTFLDALNTNEVDSEAPVWDNTGNTLKTVNGRVGAQNVIANETGNALTVQWDVASDQSYPVSYDIVLSDIDTGTTSTYTNVAFDTNPQWTHTPADHAANQYTLSGVQTDRSYTVRVVAKDAKGNVNASDTGIVYRPRAIVSNPIAASDITFDGELTEWATWQRFPSDPDDVTGLNSDGNQANWRSIQIAHTPSDFYFAYTNETDIFISWGFQLFVDSDNNQNTGFNQGFGGIAEFPIGADYMIEGVNIYQYQGPGWNWVPAPAAQGFEIGRIWLSRSGEVQIPRHWLGSPQDSFKFIAFGNNGYYGFPNEFDWYPDGAQTSNAYFEYTLVP